MPSCAICIHPKHFSIDKLLVEGQSERTVAHQFSVSRDSIHRHKKHIDLKLLKARDLNEMLEADNLLGQIKHLQREAYDNLELAKGERDVKSISMALREARGNLELLARLLGKLQETKVVNVLISPEWLSIKVQILGALEAFPEAKEAIVEALQTHTDGEDELEGGTN
ncbi:hypothetical protein MYX76_07100 [Desulfobacterota bacterium AH_259_B03_O07]|nr:hypothetical protein [Desulfobacterota bacterium AH_259_B03_O07]